MTTALGLATDLKAGMIDRFRTLPMARSAVLAGRTLADLCRSGLALAFMVGLGLLVGFRSTAARLPTSARCCSSSPSGMPSPGSSPRLGSRCGTRRPLSGGHPAALLLFFASSAFVPVANMPGWLQPFANHQPVSVIINAVRALFEGGPVFHDLWLSIVWCIGIFVVFLVLALNLYRKATA